MSDKGMYQSDNVTISNDLNVEKNSESRLTNGRLINPPPPGVEPPPLSRGGFINLFLKSSDPSGACGGLFEKVNFPFNVFVKCPIK